MVNDIIIKETIKNLQVIKDLIFDACLYTEDDLDNEDIFVYSTRIRFNKETNEFLASIVSTKEFINFINECADKRINVVLCNEENYGLNISFINVLSGEGLLFDIYGSKCMDLTTRIEIVNQDGNLMNYEQLVNLLIEN